MAKCWTCGTSVGSYSYECSSCKKVVQEVQNLDVTISGGLKELTRIQEAGFHQLSSQLAEIASILEWGFGELSWQLQQQTDVLRSIDHTLKTPSETQAEEWRKMAEKLRSRGVLDESEEFFLKALESNRLDYRIYIGLARTHLQGNKFDEAKAILERSLPHAPKQEIDYKSFSYRLIGHIYACMEDYDQAVTILKSSIELSPNYEDGHYDYAQYCAQKRKTEVCKTSLQKAIVAKPIYWRFSQREQNFDPIRNEIEELLSNLSTEMSSQTEELITQTESELEQAQEVIAEAGHAKSMAGYIYGDESQSGQYEQDLLEVEAYLKRVQNENSSETFEDFQKRMKADMKAEPKLLPVSNILYEQAAAKLKTVNDKVKSKDYVTLGEAKHIAEESLALAKKSIQVAHQAKEHYKIRRSVNLEDALFTSLRYGGIGGVVGWLIGGLGGCIMRIGKDPSMSFGQGVTAYIHEGIIIGLIVAGIVGSIVGFLNFRKGFFD